MINVIEANLQSDKNMQRFNISLCCILRIFVAIANSLKPYPFVCQPVNTKLEYSQNLKSEFPKPYKIKWKHEKR